MEQDNLDILKKIKTAEISDGLYVIIVHRTEQNRAKTMPLYKVGIAASLLFGLIIGQLFFVAKTSKTSKDKTTQSAELIELNNNALYYE